MTLCCHMALAENGEGDVSRELLPIEGKTDTTVLQPVQMDMQPTLDEGYIESSVPTPQIEATQSQSCGTMPVKVSGYKHYVGECLQGLAHGMGKATGKKGVYIGHFQNGYFDGQGQLSNHLDGKEYVGSFKQGKREGEIKTLDSESGYTRIALFQNDVFQEWLDKANDIGKDTPTIIRPNYRSTASSTGGSSSIGGQSQPFIGMETSYGKIIAITADTFTAEKYYPNTGKIERKQYPNYYLK